MPDHQPQPQQPSQPENTHAKVPARTPDAHSGADDSADTGTASGTRAELRNSQAVAKAEQLAGRIKEAWETRNQPDTTEPLSTTYELLTVPQDKSSLRDLRGALATPGLVGKWNAVYQVYQHHRIGRAVNRYFLQRGKLAAGGITFMAVFSIAGLATVGWTLFAMFFHMDYRFQMMVAEAVNQFIPGIMITPDDPDGLLNPMSLQPSTGTYATGIIGFLVALWAASRVVRYLADGVRSMFGLLTFPGRSLFMYPRYFLALLLLLLAVLATAVLTVASDHLLSWVSHLFGIVPPLQHTFTSDLLTLTVPFLIDGAMFWVVVRLAADVKVPTKTLLAGSAVFGLASTLLRYVGSTVIGMTNNPLTAAAATVITVMVWINVLARITLVICAWMADPPAMVTRVDRRSIHLQSAPNYVTSAAPHTLEWPYHPISGDLIPARALTISQAKRALTEAEAVETDYPLHVSDEDEGEDGWAEPPTLF